MPAILDDPAARTIYRVSGEPPYPDPANPCVPPTIVPRHVTLRDRQTVATVVPFASRHQVPESLLRYLSDQFNKEIEGGDTYPMLEPMPFDNFASYWFQNFGGIMLLGHIESAAEVVECKDWSKECLGTFYIKPNYPGRSSHICNAGFIVTDAARNRGVGRLMGETYLDWAPKLGYTYSVFNLVYETNVASCKIWDALGFKRIGRVKGAGNLKSHPDRLVDAIIYGRELGDAAGGAGNDELVSEERFDKIKFYLKYGRYPNGADRAEKSRLRSAATHYKLLDGDVLMLKDKEVISDPQRQYEIARAVHNQAHGGINKTTSTIAERYHWSRIKETVSDVIRNCAECKDTGKASSSQSQQPSPAVSVTGLKRSNLNAAPVSASKRASPSPSAAGPASELMAGGQPSSMSPLADPSHLSPFVPSHHQFADHNAISILPQPARHPLPSSTDGTMAGHGTITRDPQSPILQDAVHGALHPHHHHPHHHGSPTQAQVALSAPSPNAHVMSVPVPVPGYEPIDPQIISQSITSYSPHVHPSPHHHHHNHHYPFSRPSPPPVPPAAAVPPPPPPPHHHAHTPPQHYADTDAADAETFRALINAAATDDDDDDDDDGDQDEDEHKVEKGEPNFSGVLGARRGEIGAGEGSSCPTTTTTTTTTTTSTATHLTHEHEHEHGHRPGSHGRETREHAKEGAQHDQEQEHHQDQQDEAEQEAADRDLEMLIETQVDGDGNVDDEPERGRELEPEEGRQRLGESAQLGSGPGPESAKMDVDIDAVGDKLYGKRDLGDLLAEEGDDDASDSRMKDRPG